MGKMSEKPKPNVLFLMMDELRFPQHENDEIKEWRKKNLKAQSYLEKTGINFVKNYAASCACSPSRTSIFTGQYPSLHGVTQTPGAAKGDVDPDMFWLTQNSVPTLGNYFSNNGYKCFYSGKWHISDSELFVPGTWNQVTSYDVQGYPDKIRTNYYLKANVLKDFGFNSYVGPSPTGTDPQNSGSSSTKDVSGRDVIYADDAVKMLHKFEKDSHSHNEDKPWFQVVSLCNPHDITLYGKLTDGSGQYNFEIDESVPYIPPSPTANEKLDTKPPCQIQYKEKYQVGFQPTEDTDDYRKLYYSLILNADRNLAKVLKALNESKFKENTIVIFLSDHGDYLGSHGLFQKWYSAYDEAIHVPLIIKIPKSLRTENTLPKGTKLDILTSNVDVFPTLLSLCGINKQKSLKKLLKTHTEARELVGQDLSQFIYGAPIVDEPILFTTNDDVFKGDNMTTFTGNQYLPIRQSTNIQTVITYITNKHGKKELWKYSRYYDDPDFWTTPNVQNITEIKNTGYADKEVDDYLVTKNATVTITKDKPENEDYETYNLTLDPLEQYNLSNEKYSNKHNRKIIKYLSKLLEEQVSQKLLQPVDKSNPKAKTIQHLPKFNWGT